MTDKEMEQVKRMWLQGFTTTEIARVLPYREYLSVREIRNLKKQGVLPSRSVKAIRTEQVITEFQKNKNLMEIADKFGIKYSYVLRILHDNKIKHPKVMNFYKNEPSDKVQQIVEDLKRGISQSEIARKYGVSRQYIFQIKESFNNEQ